MVMLITKLVVRITILVLLIT